MQIIGDGLGRDPEQLCEMFERLPEEHQGFVVLQIAYVLAEDCVVILCQAKRVFQFSAAGKNFSKRLLEINRLRNVTARTPEHTLLTAERADYGIVYPHVYVAVVNDEPIRNIA